MSKNSLAHAHAHNRVKTPQSWPLLGGKTCHRPPVFAVSTQVDVSLTSSVASVSPSIGHTDLARPLGKHRNQQNGASPPLLTGTVQSSFQNM